MSHCCCDGHTSYGAGKCYSYFLLASYKRIHMDTNDYLQIGVTFLQNSFDMLVVFGCQPQTT